MNYKLNKRRRTKSFDGYKKNPEFFKIQTIPINYNSISGSLFQTKIPPKDWKFESNHTFKIVNNDINLDAKLKYKRKRDGY